MRLLRTHDHYFTPVLVEKPLDSPNKVGIMGTMERRHGVAGGRVKMNADLFNEMQHICFELHDRPSLGAWHALVEVLRAAGIPDSAIAKVAS